MTGIRDTAVSTDTAEQVLEVLDGDLSEDDAWMRTGEYASRLREMKLAGKWTVGARRGAGGWYIEIHREG